jgi:cyclopropane-fatty-acyl-phospholipid synthase
MPDQNSWNLVAAETATAARNDLDDFWSRALLKRFERLQHGRLTLLTPNKSLLGFGAVGDEPAISVAIHHPRIARRLALGGSVAFAEAYIDGDWDSPDLVGLIMLAIANEKLLGLDEDGPKLVRILDRLRHGLKRNSRRGSQRNIAYHYDLGNEFYAAWLDPGMTYSSALFAREAEDLGAAQERKYRRVGEFLELAPGQRLLEIGCGWGGFAEFASETGCAVTGLTVSHAQAEYARERLRRKGHAAEIRLEDYRDVRGSFDRIASIEMVEAVGEGHWATYFGRLRELLAPGGVAVLQAITIADERFAAYRRAPDFIQRHIFPGGMLLSPSVLREASARAGLRLVEGPRFGDSYARTLALWQERFQAAWPRIANLGFDRRFKRLWEYYLAYCEAGFRAATLDVGLYRLERD